MVNLHKNWANPDTINAGKPQKKGAAHRCFSDDNYKMSTDEGNETQTEAFPGIREMIGKKGLKFGHININGLVNKLSEVKTLLKETNLTVLAVSETHLAEDVNDTQIDIDGYNFLRHDRKGKKNNWGGTLIYYKDHINMYELQYDQHMHAIEAVWAEIILKSQKILVACIYRPPKQKDFLKHFVPILEKFSKRSNIVLLGDLNIDLSKDDAYLSAILHRTLARYALQNVIKDFTRITSNSKTLIDLVITTINNKKILKSGSYDSAISDHNLIFVTMNFFIDRPPAKLTTVKNYKNIDLAKLKSDLDDVPWHVVSIFDDVDDCVWTWEKLFKETINEHINTWKAKIRPQSEPWMSGAIRKELNKRYKLFQTAKNTPKGSNEWKIYKRHRNFCTNLIKRAKTTYWREEFGNAENSKSF